MAGAEAQAGGGGGGDASGFRLLRPPARLARLQFQFQFQFGRTSA